jgi:MarR family transcriptional regulator, transcriptional regulator for hemolysin
MVDALIRLEAHHELDAPPWKRFESTLMATSKSIRRSYDLRFAEIGLNLSEACLLEYVVEHGPISQTQVAERIGMGRAPAGSIVDSLSNRSLIRRLADPTDRRVWLLTATEEGLTLASRLVEIDRTLRSELRKGLSQKERAILAETLLRLQANLSGVLGPSPEILA